MSEIRLVTPDELDPCFYEALGFTETHDMSPGVRAFVRFGA